MDFNFASLIALKQLGLIWGPKLGLIGAHNLHQHYRGFALENCYSLQLAFYHAST